MSDPRPDPLTSADCNLRGLEWMPLDVITLPESDLWLKGSADACKAAVTLWCKAWRQVPAASLPNDDESLATLAQVKSVRIWRGLREQALRGWVECSDGRLYHPVLAEKAMEALPHRQEFVEKKKGDTDRKTREREDRKRMAAELRAVGIVVDWNIKTSELRTKHAARFPSGATPSPAPTPSPSPSPTPSPTPAPSVPPPVTPVTPPVTPPVTARTGHDTTRHDHSSIPSEGVPPAPPPGGQADLLGDQQGKPERRQKPRPAEAEAPTTGAWNAYAAAFFERYKVEPIRNAMVNGQLTQLVARIGAKDAPDLAAWYVRHPHRLSLYRDTHHKIGLLVRDCESLHAQWQQLRAGIAPTQAPSLPTRGSQRMAPFAGHAAAGAARPPAARPGSDDVTDVEVKSARTLPR